MLIRLRGREVDFQAVASQLEQRVNGNSLTEMRDAAQRLGHSAAIEKRPTLQLDSSILPVIVFLKASDVASNTETGHFVVLLAVNAESVAFIDGTTGQCQQVDKDWFTARAPGYILKINEDNVLGKLHIATSVVIVLLSICLCRICILT